VLADRQEMPVGGVGAWLATVVLASVADNGQRAAG
jgi:hypothetical protein